jgi:hypothetical protein
VRGVASVSGRDEGGGVKVFWFFFSKKNTFLLFVTFRNCSTFFQFV